MKKFITIGFLFCSVLAAAQPALPLIKISANQRYFQTADGKPFFWLGDTGWLLFTKCNREDALLYLDTRKQQGFNVVQVMVLHSLSAVNAYGDSALLSKNIAQPKKEDAPAEHNYWNHIDFIIGAAAKRGIYIALVPVWGANVKDGKISVVQATAYATFLAERYKKYSNIIWLNGGDIKGSDAMDVWNAIGATIKKCDADHLRSFHPRGRNSSSEWFQQERWLDFNMFQSGHKDYAQDTSSNENNHYGEDNWKFVNADYKLLPVKPTIDGEPSYENIPHGLHDSLQARWAAADLRRYAYWSVFAGAAGFTYGENAIMQFYSTGRKAGSFGVNKNWKETIHAAGAEQMKYVKKLMLLKPYFERLPAQEIIVDNNGSKYDYLLATQGKTYAMLYTYTGKNFRIDMAKLHFTPVKASWFNTKDGGVTGIDSFTGKRIVEFDPPGKPEDGNDWVLILE